MGENSRVHISFFDSTGSKDALLEPPPSLASFFLIARRSESTRALARESSDLEMVMRRKSFNLEHERDRSAHGDRLEKGERDSTSPTRRELSREQGEPRSS